MNNTDEINQDMLPEYNFDYANAKPNRFATQKIPVTVTLDADIAQIFTNSEAVNNALRAILMALPNSQFHEKV